MSAVAKTENVGLWFINGVSGFGACWLFLFKVISSALVPPYGISLLFKQVYSIGVQSISVVALVGGFTGAVLAVQGEYTLSKFGATAFTGSAIALSLIRELGPVLTALMVNGRAGSAMTAELGIMKISEQVDALRSMAVDPVHHLMVPRILAGLISVPLLTAIFNVVGIFGGYVVAVGTLGLSSGTFISVMVQSVGTLDVWSGFVKSVFFGLLRLLDSLLQGLDMWLWCGGSESRYNKCGCDVLCDHLGARLLFNFNIDERFL